MNYNKILFLLKELNNIYDQNTEVNEKLSRIHLHKPLPPETAPLNHFKTVFELKTNFLAK